MKGSDSLIKQIRPSYYHNKKNTQYCCLSTDTLPDYLQNGDEVYFIDTGKNYFYNATTGELVEDKSSGSGLPDITNADNGKVLTAKDGDWIPQSSVYTIPLVMIENDDMGVPSENFSDLIENYNNYQNFEIKLYHSDTIDETHLTAVVPARKANFNGLDLILSDAVNDRLVHMFDDMYTGSEGETVQIYIPMSNLLPTYRAGVAKYCTTDFHIYLEFDEYNKPSGMSRTAQEITDAIKNNKRILFLITSTYTTIIVEATGVNLKDIGDNTFLASCYGNFINTDGQMFSFKTSTDSPSDNNWSLEEYDINNYIVHLSKIVDNGYTQILSDKPIDETIAILDSGNKNVVFLLDGIKGHYSGSNGDYRIIFPVDISNRYNGSYITLSSGAYIYQDNYVCPDLIEASPYYTYNEDNEDKVMMLETSDIWPRWCSVERLYPVGTLLTDLLIAAMWGLAGNDKVAYTAVYEDTDGAWELTKDICNSFERGRGTIITMDNISYQSNATGIRMIGYDSSDYNSADNRGTIIVRFSGTLFNSNVDENTTNQDLYNFDIYLQSQCLGPVDEEPTKTYAVSIVGEKINSTVIINGLQQQ